MPSEDNAPGYVTYDLEKEAQEGAPQRVWILAGGGAVERHASLAAGLNIWHQLRKQSDIKVGAPCGWQWGSGPRHSHFRMSEGLFGEAISPCLSAAWASTCSQTCWQACMPHPQADCARVVGQAARTRRPARFFWIMLAAHPYHFGGLGA